MYDLSKITPTKAGPEGSTNNVSDDVKLPSPRNGQFDWTPGPYSDQEIEERARKVVESKIDFGVAELDVELPSAAPADPGFGGPDRVHDTIPPEPGQPYDNINPSHYRSHPSGVECIEITEHMNFCVGNAIKYLWRAGLKPEADARDDLMKARWYVQRELRRLGYIE